MSAGISSGVCCLCDYFGHALKIYTGCVLFGLTLVGFHCRLISEAPITSLEIPKLELWHNLLFWAVPTGPGCAWE